MAPSDDDFGPLARRIGVRLRQFREAKGLSLRRFAAVAGLAPSAVSKIENGLQGENLRQLEELATLLGVDPVDLCIAPDDREVGVAQRLRYELIEATRELSPNQLRALLQTVRAFDAGDGVTRKV